MHDVLDNQNWRTIYRPRRGCFSKFCLEIKVPHCGCEIINTGLSDVDKSCFKELEGQTSCRIFVADGFAGKDFVSDGFVVAIGPLEGLAIVRKAVEYCISYSSYSKAMSTVVATSKKLNDY